MIISPAATVSEMAETADTHTPTSKWIKLDQCDRNVHAWMLPPSMPEKLKL